MKKYAFDRRLTPEECAILRALARRFTMFHTVRPIVGEMEGEQGIIGVEVSSNFPIDLIREEIIVGVELIPAGGTIYDTGNL